MMDNLQPIYRIEDYWYAIVNGLSCPHTPIYRIEQYLAYLCGADVSVPQPIYRIEQYLAYKCGLDVELPKPIYRQEMFLAKWCGIDCEVPEPMYRIEYWLAQLANSGELKTVTGNPISISDALVKPAEALSIEILPQQDLHGYSNPWPAGGGKQIYNSSTFGTVTLGKITCTNNGDGSFTINADEADTVDRYFDIFNNQFSESKGGTPLPSAEYRLTGTPSGGSMNTYTMYTRPSYSNDMGTGVTFTNSVIGGSILIKAGYRPQNLVFRPMLRLASNGDDTFATYSNICPITGCTGVNIYHESAYDPDADPTYSIDWTDDAGTVYGGTLDVTTGVLTVERVVVDLGDSNLSWKASSQINKFYCTDAPDYKPGADTEMMCSIYKFDGAVKVAPYYGENGTIRCWARSSDATNKELYVHDDRFSDLASFVSAMSGVQLVYELATPLTYQLTPTEIEMLLGNNVIWNDVGDMVLEYLADGPADDIDALNILLNNRYVNNGEPDEATDKEALEILLGGNTR